MTPIFRTMGSSVQITDEGSLWIDGVPYYEGAVHASSDAGSPTTETVTSVDANSNSILVRSTGQIDLDFTVATVDETITIYQGESTSVSVIGFAVTNDDRADFLENIQETNKLKPQRLSALLREHSIRGLPPYWVQFTKEPYGALGSNRLVPIFVYELLARWPQTVPERLNRTLCNFARLSGRGGRPVDILGESRELAFAESDDEADYHIGCLVDRKYLKNSGSGFDTAFVLTAKGWDRHEQLTREASSPENPVFVAMCFGLENPSGPDAGLTKEYMLELYLMAIKPAVTDAWYKVDRVDLEPHNDYIMDKVIGDMRLAPFVVADFTGNRNGVYFEAGFARGLGIPVIHTCRKDHLKDAHFDTKQLNHVLWCRPDELREGLHNRIMGTMGRGPYPPPTVNP